MVLTFQKHGLRHNLNFTYTEAWCLLRDEIPSPTTQNFLGASRILNDLWPVCFLVPQQGCRSDLHVYTLPILWIFSPSFHFAQKSPILSYWNCRSEEEACATLLGHIPLLLGSRDGGGISSHPTTVTKCSVWLVLHKCCGNASNLRSGGKGFDTMSTKWCPWTRHFFHIA